MKTLIHTLIALLILFMNTESYSSVGNLNDDRNINACSLIPVSPRNWDDAEAEVPESLRFIKAKYALVPVPAKVWTDIEISQDEFRDLGGNKDKN